MKKARRNHSGRRQRVNGRTNGNSKKARVALETEEVGVILRACRKYRANMPVYLESVKPEMHAVDDVIRKLSQG